MEKYSFIDEISQIRGVMFLRENPFEDGKKQSITIRFDMGSQDDGDLEKLHEILKNQKLVDWNLEFVKTEKVKL